MRDPLDALTERIIGAAIDVHRESGPGLLESSYKACMAFELVERGIGFQREKELPIIYHGRRLECGYRIDFLVESVIVVELKAWNDLSQSMPLK